MHKDEPEKSHVGHDPHIVVVREGEDGILLNADNSTYCGSCYGSQQHPDECCNTCADVRERYRIRGWAFSTAGTVEQCKREGLLETIALQVGEGCQVYGHFEVNKVAGNFHFAPGKSFQQGNMHVHDLMAFGMDAYFNMSHVVNKARIPRRAPTARAPPSPSRCADALPRRRRRAAGVWRGLPRPGEPSGRCGYNANGAAPDVPVLCQGRAHCVRGHQGQDDAHRPVQRDGAPKVRPPPPPPPAPRRAGVCGDV